MSGNTAVRDKRVEALRKELRTRYTAKEFRAIDMRLATGIGLNTISRFVHGESRSINNATLEAMEKYLHDALVGRLLW